MAVEYENMIRVMSRSLREELGDHAELIQLLKSAILSEDPDLGETIEVEQHDLDSFIFDAGIQEILLITRRSPALSLVRILSLRYPGKRFRLEWRGDYFRYSGRSIYLDGNQAEYEERNLPL